LLADPVIGDLVFVRIANLQVITKYLVKGDLQRANTRALDFPFLNLEQEVLTRKSNPRQFIQLIVDPFADKPSLIAGDRHIITQLPLDFLKEKFAGMELIC